MFRIFKPAQSPPISTTRSGTWTCWNLGSRKTQPGAITWHDMPRAARASPPSAGMKRFLPGTSMLGAANCATARQSFPGHREAPAKRVEQGRLVGHWADVASCEGLDGLKLLLEVAGGVGDPRRPSGSAGSGRIFDGFVGRADSSRPQGPPAANRRQPAYCKGA